MEKILAAGKNDAAGGQKEEFEKLAKNLDRFLYLAGKEIPNARKKTWNERLVYFKSLDTYAQLEAEIRNFKARCRKANREVDGKGAEENFRLAEKSAQSVMEFLQRPILFFGKETFKSKMDLFAQMMLFSIGMQTKKFAQKQNEFRSYVDMSAHDGAEWIARTSEVTGFYKPKKEEFVDAFFQNLRTEYYRRNPNMNEGEKKLVDAGLEGLKKGDVLVKDVDFYFKQLDLARGGVEMPGYAELQNKIVDRGEIPDGYDETVKLGVRVYFDKRVNGDEVESIIDAAQAELVRLPPEKRPDRIVVSRLPKGNDLEFINGCYDPEHNQLAIFLGSRNISSGTSGFLISHEMAHAYYENGIADHLPVAQIYAEMMHRYRQTKTYDTIKKLDYFEPLWTINVPLFYGTAAGEADALIRLFDESTYEKGQKVAVGHPYDNSNEMFASGTDILMHHPREFFAGAEKLSKTDPEAGKLALKIAKTIVDAWGSGFFPKEVHRQLRPNRPF